MYRGVQCDIPEFLNNQIIYCDNFISQRRRRFCWVLTKDLCFYEFQNKNVIRTFDLHKTCLKDLVHQLNTYKGNRGKWFESNQGNDNYNKEPKVRKLSPKISKVQKFPIKEINKNEIHFGKFVFRTFDRCRIYVLIKCFDKMVILERIDTPNCNLFENVGEYENVASYELVNSYLKYSAQVLIKFQCGKTFGTDFNESESVNASLKPEDQTEFSETLHKYKQIKCLLHMHKADTQKQFERLKNTQAFGDNCVRNFSIEEKQILVRCGDIWLRITGSQSFVIGVPLMNNCCSSNIRILKNIKPILKINDKLKGITYDYRLYQFSEKMENLNLSEQFFHNDEFIPNNNRTWNATSSEFLLPESYVVLLIKLKICKVIDLVLCPLFLHFQLEKNTNNETKIFEQKIFLKNFNFHEIFSQLELYQVNFEEKTLHQDFLAIVMTYFQTNLFFEFQNLSDLQIFSDLLSNKFELKSIQNSKGSISNEENEIDIVNLNYLENITTNLRKSRVFYYNSKSSSIWFGVLAIMEPNKLNFSDKPKNLWKFFIQDERCAYVLFKLLFNDLILHKCNITQIENINDHLNSEKCVEFGNALRQEIQSLLELINKRKVNEDFERVAELQMRTDALSLIMN